MKGDLSDKSFVEGLVSKKISKYEVKNGCEEGDNVAGSLKKLEIVTTEGEKLNVIFKYLSANSPPWLIWMQVFRREHGVYRTLVPLLNEFARNRGLVSYEPPLPKLYSGFNDDKNDYICLEDLRPSGFIMPDKRKTLNAKEMSLILREFAKFHAISYALLQEKGESLFETEDLGYLKMPEREHPDPFDMNLQAYYEESTKVLEGRNAELANRMKSLGKDAWKVKNRTDSNQNYFTTLIHYDLWTNNLLIKYDEKSGDPYQVKFIDFQFCSKGNIFTDLQYLILTSTTPEFRKDHLLTILGRYYDEFSRTLDAMKCPLPTGFTRGYLIDEFYKCFLPGFVHMTFAIALQLGDISSPKASENEDGSAKHEAETAFDPANTESVQKYYLQSPIALQRLESLVQELVDLKFL